MGVELNGNFNRLFNGFDKVKSEIRSKESRHILYANGIGSRLFNLFGIIFIIFKVKHGACCVGYGDLSVSHFFFCGVNGGLKISDVVKGIENTDNVDTVCHRFLHKIFHDIIGIVTVAEHILPAEKHLQLGVFAFIPYYSKSFPRVLVEKAQASVKGCAAPAFERVKTDFIEQRKDGKHFLGGHSRCDKRLVSVAKHRFGYTDFRHKNSSLTDCDDGRAGFHNVILGNVDRNDGAVSGSLDFIFHFHGFENHHNIAGFKLVSRLDPNA